MMKDNYQMVREFHQIFDDRIKDRPTQLPNQEVAYRSEFMLEELLEFLVADAHGKSQIKARFVEIETALKRAEEKVLTKKRPSYPDLVKQSDALGDLIYLAYGTFALMGIDPKEIIASIHQANLEKLFPDGRPHYDSRTKKVLKPDNWHGPESKIQATLEKQRILDM